MSLENSQSGGQGDIAQFLEKFKDPNLNTFDFKPTEPAPRRRKTAAERAAQYERSFEKLEQKVQELEEKFDVSARQNEEILSELAHTREHIERQQDRDSFLEHLSFSIANLRASVENLTRAQQDRSFAYREPDVQRSFDSVSRPSAPHAPIYQYEPDQYRQAQERRQQEEQAEKERIISSLHQKASQLKAVNTALDREIKKVQQEKMEALKKSAEQAKEILSLREQLTQAEARFKSFDFEGRIISIRQEYEQRVNILETQLKEISDTCMKQVEEIEILRAENIKLQQAAAEKEQLLVRLGEKEKELQSLKEEMAALQSENTLQSQNQQAIFSETIRSLETQRDELTIQLQAAQNELDAVRGEKEQLEKNFKTLLEKINSNDAIIEQLKQKIDVLGKQNEQLAKQNRQLTGRQNQLEQQLTENRTIPSETKTPVLRPKPIVRAASQPLPSQTAQPVAKKIAQPLQPKAQPVKETLPLLSAAAAPVDSVAQNEPVLQAASSVTPAEQTSLLPAQVVEESPMEITERAKTKVQTSADLPEIRVAEPAEQEDPLLAEGEDFLEKTGNFIGRIKWSIFNEDR